MGELKIDRRRISINDFCEMFGKSKAWVYANSHALRPAVICLNGKPLKPFQFDAEILSQLLSAGEKVEIPRSLKTQEKSKSVSHKTATKGDLWR